MKPEVDVIEAIEERMARDGVSSLTDAERFYWAIDVLEAETSNGSFHQFFWNDSGLLAHDALLGLRAVGAGKMAHCLDQAIDLFPGRVIPEHIDERKAVLDSLTRQQIATLDKLSNRFSDYPDDLHALKETYVREHDTDFRGPRTKLELWRSKRARGANTAPRYVARKIDFAIEAEEDRPFSSRSCPVCDYPNPDYRETCKQCGFPHGKVRRQ